MLLNNQLENNMPSALCKCQSFHSSPNTMPRPDLVITRWPPGISYAVVYESLILQFLSLKTRLICVKDLSSTTQMYTYIYINIYAHTASSHNVLLVTTSSQTKFQYNVRNVPRPAFQDSTFIQAKTLQKHSFVSLQLRPITTQFSRLSFPTHTCDCRSLPAD
jgi:hypothetical protein